MTGLAIAIVDGARLHSPYPAILVGADHIVIVECVVGEDPDEERDPPDEEEEFQEAAE